jgi:hypothetical protein
MTDAFLPCDNVSILTSTLSQIQILMLISGKSLKICFMASGILIQFSLQL